MNVNDIPAWIWVALAIAAFIGVCTVIFLIIDFIVTVHEENKY